MDDRQEYFEKDKKKKYRRIYKKGYSRKLKSKKKD